MPFPNHHASRIKSPDAFQPDSFRTNTLPNGIIQIMGKLKGEDTMTVQSLRFPKDKFTAEQSKAWMKEHNITAIAFEPASATNSLEYEDISNIEVFKQGIHNGDPYSADDMDDFVNNFRTLRNKLIPKVKITHAENQKKVAGLASYGDVKNVFTKVVGGTKKLFVDLVRVPDEVAQWIRDGRFAERSIEVFRNITIDGKKFKNVLAKVALLGHEIPAVSGMGSIRLSIENDMSSDLITSDFDVSSYSYEMESEDNICIFKISEGGGDMDLLAELKKHFKELGEKIDAVKDPNSEAGKATLLELQEQMKTFEAQIQEAGKAEGDNKKLATELETKNEEIKGYKAKDVKSQEDLRKQNIDTFVTECKTKGKVLPAFEKEVKTLLYSLDNGEKKKDYTMIIKTQADGDVPQELTQLEYAMKLFEKISKIVTYGEITPAGEDMDKHTGGNKEEKVKIAGNSYVLDNADQEAKIKAYMVEHKCSEEDAACAVMDAAGSNKAPE